MKILFYFHAWNSCSKTITIYHIKTIIFYLGLRISHVKTLVVMRTSTFITGVRFESWPTSRNREKTVAAAHRYTITVHPPKLLLNPLVPSTTPQPPSEQFSVKRNSILTPHSLYLYLSLSAVLFDHGARSASHAIPVTDHHRPSLFGWPFSLSASPLLFFVSNLSYSYFI